MASVLSDFEYDIFISYRHNDNRSGWVTEFVKSLQEELAGTIKESVSVYFDSNPHDGLLETHNVDKSLEGKLKSVILIPVLSQVYCDTKSFAWQNEFCAFNKISSSDTIGRDIQLRNGNIASRIVPVLIHKLDPEDQNLIEEELKSKLRFIDFTFQSPGVNRALRKEDKRQENASQSIYHDQLNKLANAIKEIISAIQNPGRAKISGTKSGETNREDEDRFEKSLAVLPFTNLSQDPAQEYFADGITENILIQLAGMAQFRVISKTSVMRFKKTNKTAPEIAEELGIKYIIEGSAQAHKDKVRISIQLIDAIKDQPVWTKVFVESFDDIFAIQTSVAETVAKELNASLNPQQVKKIKEKPTQNLEAYDLFLKGRHAFNQWSVEGYRIASEYFKRAIAKDPEFRDAYSYLASSYSGRMSWNGDLGPNEAKEQIELYLNEAWKRGPSDNDYLTKAFVEFFIKKNFQTSEELLTKAIELNSSNADILYLYSYLLNMMGRHEEAIQWIGKAKLIDPLSVAFFNYQIVTLHLMGKNQEALDTLSEGLQLYPSVLRFYDFKARIYLTLERWKEAEEAVLTGFRISTIRPPTMVAYLSIAYSRLQQTEKAQEFLNELISRSNNRERGVNICISYIFNSFGDFAKAEQWLNKAVQTNDVALIWRNVDPLYKGVQSYLGEKKNSGTDFNGVEKYLLHRLENEMPKHKYHNIDHVHDVLQAAQVIAENERVTEEEMKLIRVAALLHDVGFIFSPKNHEQKGAEMTNEILPFYGFTSQQIEIISNMILATRLPQSPVSKLEKILCDADLDYLGRDDFYETGEKLFQEMLAEGAVESLREWNLVQRTFLQLHRFHTEFGRQKREHQKQERLKEIIARLSQSSN